MRIKEVGRHVRENDFLWRYFDLQKFLSLVIDRSLFFSRMDKMEDENEGISINQLLLKYGSDFEREIARRNQLSSSKRELKIEVRQKKYFLSCWLHHHRESVAMWNSYSDDDGIALRINARRLIEAVSSNISRIEKSDAFDCLYFGKVVYKDFLNLDERMQFKDEIEIIGFQKDSCFEHEREFRFLLKQKVNSKRGPQIPFVKVPLPHFDELPFELVFHPRMERWKKDNLRQVLLALGNTQIHFIDSELKLKNW